MSRIESHELNFNAAISSNLSQRRDEPEPGLHPEADAESALDAFTENFSFREFEDAQSVRIYRGDCDLIHISHICETGSVALAKRRTYY